jgi:hypothetical protein
MTLWKSERSSTYGPAHHELAPHLDLAVVVATTAAAGVLLVWWVPSPLLLPALGLMSFIAVGIVTLFAYHSGADRHADGITLWDVAGIFTLIWIAAGMLSEPEHVVQLFGHLTTAQ